MSYDLLRKILFEIFNVLNAKFYFGILKYRTGLQIIYVQSFIAAFCRIQRLEHIYNKLSTYKVP